MLIKPTIKSSTNESYIRKLFFYSLYGAGKRSYQFLSIILILLALIFSSGCASYKNVTWKAPETFPKRFSKLMVIALIPEDTLTRKLVEYHIVGDLQSAGYNAVSFLNTFNIDEFSRLTEAQAYQKLRQDSIDAALTVFIINEEKAEHYKIGSKAPSLLHYELFWDEDNNMKSNTTYGNDKKYAIAGNLYDLATKSLIYTVQTRSFNPISKGNLGHEYGRMLIREFQKQNVLVMQGPRINKRDDKY